MDTNLKRTLNEQGHHDPVFILPACLWEMTSDRAQTDSFFLVDVICSHAFKVRNAWVISFERFAFFESDWAWCVVL